MVVTPKANDLTGRKNSKGYIRVPWSDEVLYLVPDQMTARTSNELASEFNSIHTPYRVMNGTRAV